MDRRLLLRNAGMVGAGLIAMPLLPSRLLGEDCGLHPINPGGNCGGGHGGQFPPYDPNAMNWGMYNSQAANTHVPVANRLVAGTWTYNDIVNMATAHLQYGSDWNYNGGDTITYQQIPNSLTPSAAVRTAIWQQISARIPGLSAAMFNDVMDRMPSRGMSDVVKSAFAGGYTSAMNWRQQVSASLQWLASSIHQATLKGPLMYMNWGHGDPNCVQCQQARQTISALTFAVMVAPEAAEGLGPIFAAVLLLEYWFCGQIEMDGF